MRTPWYKRGPVSGVSFLLLGLAGVFFLFLGLAMGATVAVATANPEDSTEYQALAQDMKDTQTRLQLSEGELDGSRERITTTHDQLTATRDELTSTEDDLSSTEAELVNLVADITEREKAVEKAEAVVQARRADLDRAEAGVRSAAKAVAKRERAVGTAETRVAQNTIPGEGTFEVGVDMQPGLYKSSGATNCYYAVNADANGRQIKSKNTTSGPTTVTVNTGEYFETSRCAEWILQ